MSIRKQKTIYQGGYKTVVTLTKRTRKGDLIGWKAVVDNGEDKKITIPIIAVRTAKEAFDNAFYTASVEWGWTIPYYPDTRL